MRKKTEARRDVILNAAAQEFCERGYEGASVSAIAARIGGSKQTLYNYFTSKDDLFAEVTARAINSLMDAAYAEMMEEDDLASALRRYGERYLAVRQSPEMVALVRLVFGESGRSEIGRLLWGRCQMEGVAKVGGVLAAAMRAGKLRAADPTVAAFHLFGLLGAELVDAVILRAREPATTGEISEVVDRAVEAFVAAYRSPVEDPSLHKE